MVDRSTSQCSNWAFCDGVRTQRELSGRYRALVLGDFHLPSRHREHCRQYRQHDSTRGCNLVCWRDVLDGAVHDRFDWQQSVVRCSDNRDKRVS